MIKTILALCAIGVTTSIRSPIAYLHNTTRPLIIAHRGATGYIPEHSLQGYSTAAFMKSDYVEPDVVFTKDHHLVCMHQPWLSPTTDVEEHPEFASRKREITWDGKTRHDWFTFDFTLAELQTLKLE